jgi:N-acetylmuramoyl-L-alanine amidase
MIVLVNGGFLYLAMLAIFMGIGAWLLGEPAIWTSIPLGSMVSGRKVVIDPGHGGGDPGAKSSSGVVEKHLNLDVALRLKKYLSRVGVYCIMIRETDRDYFGSGDSYGNKKRRDLNHRIEMANQSKADIFLSIHANSFPQTIYHGAQTFYNPNNPESKRLAETIQEQMVNSLGPNHRKARKGDYRVLELTQMPGVIIEIGFLSNPEEARLLATEQYREQLAQAIYHGLIQYFRTQSPNGK